MVISSDFRKGQLRDDDHREDAPHFTETRSLGRSLSWFLEVENLKRKAAEREQRAKEKERIRREQQE